MLRLITRHGQVAKDAQYINGHLFPAGDVGLSDLGREQARLLGERLKKEGFKGKILASPFLRTMETANIVAGLTGNKVIPFAGLHEMFFTEESLSTYVGKTQEQLCEIFEHVDKQSSLEFPWWINKIETIEEMEKRVLLAKEKAEEMFPNQPILFVGHGASVHGLTIAYGIKKTIPDFIYNCALSYVDTNNQDFKKVHCDVSHIPYEMTTSNSLTREEFDLDYFDKPYDKQINLPDGINQINGKKILHIGDTHSIAYPYYKKLIEITKPDIILHTGDMADEVKVGRMPETRYEYLTKIKWFTNMLNQSGAKLIVVLGNNDIEEEIRKMLPTAEVYNTNTLIALDNEVCRIGHQVLSMTFDKEWAFYGHGPTGETWSFEKNTRDGEKRFNAYLDKYLVCISEKKFFKIVIEDEIIKAFL